ncbi:hypothetical protein OsJ_34886 [Oryza sativa Japonica Group]|uniref:Uncharacterized protein n=1 Tax=Oryza sativa subsp. japonica TaxID=39947 RepID=A3CE22_ORYSJ|nr:hypothetical protein OsJ_34886 [Oryza sativa Japonica Group]
MAASALDSAWEGLTGSFTEFQLATVVTFLLHETVFFLSGLPSLLFERFGLFAKYKIQGAFWFLLCQRHADQYASQQVKLTVRRKRN